MRFSDLQLIPQLLRALEDVGYTAPSPIQEKAIPPVLAGRDLLGCAQTGTGKTAAFALPLLQRLEQTPAPGGKPIRVLVLTPTRELAAQIQECFVDYGKYLRHRSVVIFGGVGQQPQVEQLLRKPEILVATPGRLLDLCGQGHIKLDGLEYFVLDEADRMLDMGFIHDIRRVIKLLPQKRQTLFFSATMPEEIRQLSNTLLTDPVQVAVDPVSSTVEIIDQQVLFTDKSKKRELLLWLLRDKSVTSALVFTRTKHLSDRVARFLKQRGVSADSIHGDKSQGARLRALGDFKSGKCRVLVATDIAARGIDVSGISHVFNFDLPDVPETYVHRIGRTGRAGHEGSALAFCTPDDVPSLREIEKLIRRRIPVMEDHPYPCTGEIPAPPPPLPAAKGKKQQPDAKKAKAEKAAPAAPQQAEEPAAPTAQPRADAYRLIDLDSFRDEPHTLPPLPSAGFSSDFQRPGRVAARSGGKQGSAPRPKEPPRQDAPPAPKAAQKPKKQAAKQAAPAPKGGKPREAASPAPTEPGRPSRNRRSREPVWIPLNDQPIVTRRQSYFEEPLPAAEAPPAKKKRRRRPRSGQKTPKGEA